MNPMTNVKNIKKLSEQELRRNLKTSWHDQYKGSAWVFIGGLPFDLTEGDIICVFSQYGEVVNINLVRDKEKGTSRGFCFLCYEDQRSTALAVDNFNGIKLLGRTLRVDHVQDYKPPKDSEKKTVETRRLMEEGCAPTVPVGSADIKMEKHDDKDDCMIIERANSVVDLVNNRTVKDIKSEPKDKKKKKKEKKSSKEKDKRDRELDRKKKKRIKKRSSSSSSSDDSSSSSSESSSESSTADSDSSEEKARAKKRKQKLAKKKKAKRQEEEEEEEGSREGEMSASSKRRKLEEKIKALEKALSTVRSGRNKQE